MELDNKIAYNDLSEIQSLSIHTRLGETTSKVV